MKNYYKILGVNPDASALEIKDRFISISNSLDATSKKTDIYFDLSEAVYILSYPELRKKYDYIQNNGSERSKAIEYTKDIELVAAKARKLAGKELGFFEEDNGQGSSFDRLFDLIVNIID